MNLEAMPAAQEFGSRQADAQAFLSALYGGAEGLSLCLFAVPGETSRWYPVGDTNKIARAAVRGSETHDTYFGIGLHAHPPRSGRGEALGVSCIPGLWVDVDRLHGSHSAQNLPRSMEEIRALLASFAYPPTWIVESGHGAHAWWLFREPWVFASPAEREEAARLERRFQRWFQEKAREHGWRIDSTADLARVLRLPGTINRKREPAPVRTLHQDESLRYNPADFDALLPEVEEYAVRWEPRSDGKFPLVPLAEILAGCGWMRHCRDDAKTLPEPEWYAALGVLGRCENGGELAHIWSQPHPGYERDQTERKLAHAIGAAGPRSCAAVRYELDGGRFCSVCPNWGRINSPILLGTHLGERAPMPSEEDVPAEPGSPTRWETEAAAHEQERQQRFAEKAARAAPKNGKHPPTSAFSFDKGVTAAQLQTRQFPDLVWPVPGMICEGFTLTSGREKMGKSRLFEEMAVAIATGGRVFGVDEFRAQPGRVLLLALEEEERLLQERLQQWLGDEPWPENLHIFTEWPRQDAQPSTVDFLEAWMDHKPDTVFILADTLRRIRAVNKSPNKSIYAQDSEDLQPFADFTKRHLGMSLTIVHHSNKINAEDDHDTVSGSTGLTAVPDRIMVLRRKRGEPVATLSFSGKRGPWRKIRLRDDTLAGTWVYEGEADDTTPRPVSADRYAIIEALTGRWLTATELAHDLGKTDDRQYNTLRKLLTTMKGGGTVVNVGGRWSVYGTPLEAGV